MTQAIFSATAPEDLESLCTEQGGLRVPLQLNPKERSSPASRWTLRHLIAYRLLLKSETNFLATFQSEHAALCPVCNTLRDDLPQTVDTDGTAALIQDPCPANLLHATEAELMRLTNGSFWLALARAMRPEGIELRRFPRRDRMEVERPSFVNSSTAIVGSSSPTRPSSSSDFEMSTGSIDEDEYDARRGKPEEVTVHLAMSFLQHALYTCLLQDSESLSEVRARVERQRSYVVNGIGHIVAEDDGGICRMERRAVGWTMTHPYIALLEAKRAFRHVQVNNITGETRPVVSNEVLAQCFGEAVVAWMANRRLIGQESDLIRSLSFSFSLSSSADDHSLRSVFLITASNTFLRFVHFRFGSHYAELVDSTDMATQQALVADINKDTCVHMQCSKWFNLQAAQGRRAALCHVLALLRWHDNAAEVLNNEVGKGSSDDDSDMV
ncbi:hypothetical protein Purlil1_12695 [Purpureocillium lilacinum]|uniref:Uncharacterized protein n=1 Tax=Purpureocillium lilacinum TaxID=33203 RepID=A0ABR0BGD1_PURLI|nr:hypothetical protein Purlil1_12695 [Purpureocillium lilacinum]